MFKKSSGGRKSRLLLLLVIAPITVASGWMWLKSRASRDDSGAAASRQPEGLTGYAANWRGHVESEGRLPTLTPAR